MQNLNSRRGLLIVAGLALLSFSVPAIAADTTYMRIDIPFAFLAGNEILPAGTYHVDVSNSYNYADFRSTNETKIHRVLLAASRVERSLRESEVGTLQFQRYGDRLVLRAVFNPSKSEGFMFKKSKAELELGRNATPGAVETVQSFNK